MTDGFIKIAAITPQIRVADCMENQKELARLAHEAAEQGACVAVFPELCLTGATCGDLFRDSALLSGAQEALLAFVQETRELDLIGFIGLPFAVGQDVYNVCAAILHGEILGLVPQRYPVACSARWFSTPSKETQIILFEGKQVPFGPHLSFQHTELPGFSVGIVLGTDSRHMDSPANILSRNGATILAHPAATPALAGQDETHCTAILQESARLRCAWIEAQAGEGESTTDAVFSGRRTLAETGTLLAEGKSFTPGILLSEIDTEKLLLERQRDPLWPSFSPQNSCFMVPFRLSVKQTTLTRQISPTPFLPKHADALASRCEEILSIQIHGLKKRLAHLAAANGAKAVLGLSGGLDSTLALLVAAKAFRTLSVDLKQLTAISMPGFGTTGRTKTNAQLLAEALGVTFREIPIAKAVEQHFRDIGQDPQCHDVTFENAQARERTQVLMDVANQQGGIVIGTGDLSELALGWATYNGDHMSMYGVNAGVPKTLVRHLVQHVAAQSAPALTEILWDILDTPVSPELLPPVDGKIAQKTEELVGPYALHDFFLFYLLRYGFSPEKIFRLAQAAFVGRYDSKTILHWLRTFYHRFFSQQFKRSCLPDGPKVGSVGLSPRGDYKMPSDACAALWIKEIDAMESNE